MSFAKARQICHTGVNVRWLQVAKEFLECDADFQRPLYLQTFGKIPPREVIERWAGILGAKLHLTNLMWQYEDANSYIAAVDRCTNWFSDKHRQGVSRFRGIVKFQAPVALDGTEDYSGGIVGERLEEHFRLLKSQRRIRGMRNWKAIIDICREADVQIASGTTETESMNKELAQLLFAHPVNKVTKMWWEVCVRCAFLRVVYRRSHLGDLPKFVRGDHALSARFTGLLGLLFAMQAPSSDSRWVEMEETWSNELS